MSTYYLVEPPTAAAVTPTYDYTSAYSNISTYLNQVRQELADIDDDTTPMAATMALIATSLATMAANSTTIAGKLTAIETYHKKMKELGEADGIHIRGPFETLSLISIYKLLIEQAKILDADGVVSSDLQSQSINKAEEYITKINENFKEF